MYIDRSKFVPSQRRQQFSHLPTVLLATVVHVELRISSRILEISVKQYSEAGGK